MMNKKLIALFVVVTTASMNAFIGDVVEGAGRTAGTAVGGASDVAFGTAGEVTGGKGVQERMDDRKNRREQRRTDREQRRMERKEARSAKYYRE
jgi:hypothetical protein